MPALPVERGVLRRQLEALGIGRDCFAVLPDGDLRGAESGDQREVPGVFGQGAFGAGHAAGVRLRLVTEILDGLARQGPGAEKEDGEFHAGEWYGFRKLANAARVRQWRGSLDPFMLRSPPCTTLAGVCSNADVHAHRQR